MAIIKWKDVHNGNTRYTMKRRKILQATGFTFSELSECFSSSASASPSIEM